MTKETSAPPAPPVAPPRTSQAAANVTVPTFGKAKAKLQPPRIVLNAVEGWGKTSCGAYAPEPGILMARGETGYLTLLGAGLVPEVGAASIDSWLGLLALLDEFAKESAVKTLVVDAMGGIERLCHEHVCTRDFKGDWGEKGFSSYQKGFDVAINDWLQLLQKLDVLHNQGMTILLLSHCQIRPFKNPLGEDYDRYVAAVHHKTWNVTHRWADAVLFGTFITVIDSKDGRKRGIGGTDRVLYCERRDAFDAKNRYGMPVEVEIPAEPSEIWSTIRAAIISRRTNNVE